MNLPLTPLPIPTIYVVTEPWFEFLESFSKFPLAIYLTYGNVGIDEETVETVLLFWAPKLPQMVIAAMKLKDAYSLEEKL